jgi:5-(carboxyamino)imidazole ribonucleotide synthase
LRAILDLPLGSTQTLGYAAMVNFIGGLPESQELLSLDHAHLHLYDKLPRKGRKVAHASVRSDNLKQFNECLEKLASLANRVDNS